MERAIFPRSVFVRLVGLVHICAAVFVLLVRAQLDMSINTKSALLFYPKSGPGRPRPLLTWYGSV